MPMGSNNSKAADREIPTGLTEARKSVYKTLLEVREARKCNGKPTPHVVVISDLDKDYDDLAAMTVLKELHRLGLIRLLGYVANLYPAKDRAKVARGALDSMGLDEDEVPVAYGTDGVPDVSKHTVHDYELKAKFMSKKPIKKSGQQLLTEKFEAARGKYKLTLVCLSSLTDASQFTKAQPQLFRRVIDKVMMQGGAAVASRGEYEPDGQAANNKYDIQNAEKFLQFVDQDTEAKTFSFTKIAAFNTPVSVKIFEEMAKTREKVGIHLDNVRVDQDLQFYKNAYYEELRYLPHLDTEWFLKNKTNWYETTGKDPSKKPPTPESGEILEYLTKLVIYDALPALAAAGGDAMEQLGVLEAKRKSERPERHTIVGQEGNPGVSHGGQPMSNALCALMLGSQLSYKQGMRTSFWKRQEQQQQKQQQQACRTKI